MRIEFYLHSTFIGYICIAVAWVVLCAYTFSGIFFFDGGVVLVAITFWLRHIHHHLLRTGIVWAEHTHTRTHVQARIHAVPKTFRHIAVADRFVHTKLILKKERSHPRPTGAVIIIKIERCSPVRLIFTTNI